MFLFSFKGDELDILSSRDEWCPGRKEGGYLGTAVVSTKIQSLVSFSFLGI